MISFVTEAVSEADVAMKSLVRAEFEADAAVPEPYIKMTNGKAIREWEPLAESEVFLEFHKTVRAGWVVDVGAVPSADDIAQAVWGSLTTINTEDGTMATRMRALLKLADFLALKDA